MNEMKANGQAANGTDQTDIVNGGTARGNSLNGKPIFSEARIKEVVSRQEMQKALRECVHVPDMVIVKKVRKAFEPKKDENQTETQAQTKTQKIEGICGTSLEDAESIELTLVGIELGGGAVNKKYRIVDCTLGLIANMNGGNFGGYSATGLKLMVTKLEEIK